MEPFIAVGLILLARALIEACRDKPAHGYDFLALMRAGALPVSKKARGRAQQRR